MFPPPSYLYELGKWRTYPDIAALAIVVFLLYRTFRTMGTWKAVLGLASLGVLYAAAGLLELRGVEWIFTNLSQIALLGVIILFQPEIRRVLERSAPFRRGRRTRGNGFVPGILDGALFDLAGRRWGALVVLPGRDPIEGKVSGGIALGGTPSVPLLLSLFDPNSPGHDGAVVIEDGKVEKFAVRLPLSDSSKLPESLGTRHHAAMGLAEATDAVVVAVSEERGTVSCFHHGRMTVLTKRGELAPRILAHLQGEVPAEVLAGRFKTPRVFVEAAASVLLACLLWSTVVLSHTETRERFLTVPIEYSALPAELAVSGERPQEVRVHLAGPASLLTTLDPTQVRVSVDLSQATAGNLLVALGESNVRLPRRLELVALSPEIIPLDLKAVRQAELPVTPQILGQLPSDRRLVAVTVHPPSVRALVFADSAKMQTKVTTTPIYLHGLRDTQTVMSKIAAPTGIQPADKRWPDVEVRVEVAPAAKH